MNIQRSQGLALDASVLISLVPTDRLSDILTALGTPLVVTDQAYKEVYIDPRDRARNPELLAPFAADGLFRRVTLTGAALELFLDLAAAPSPDDLNDGECATLAYADRHGLGVVVDETKARNLCRRLFPSVAIHCTVELLRAPEVVQALGYDGLVEALFRAVHLGRTRVPVEHDAWVRERLGPERVAMCRSLKRRR